MNSDSSSDFLYAEIRHYEVTHLSLTLKPRVSVRAKITAVGAFVPPRLLTNKDLENMVATNDQWIMERTGIRERHIVDKGVATSDLAVEAAKKCLATRGIEPSEIDCIIVATVTPDMIFPATACLVQDKLGAKGAWGFDLSAACSGFPYALQVGAKLVESGVHTKVLVIGADVMSSIIDYTDRSTCVIFGDGAGAVLLEPCVGDEVGLIDFLHEIDGSGASSLNMPGGGSLHPATAQTAGKIMTTSSGLQITDTTVGTGASPWQCRQHSTKAASKRGMSCCSRAWEPDSQLGQRCSNGSFSSFRKSFQTDPRP